jgi:hypothetical protein
LWALGQHYGLATPLLDWSKSPYIGLFFSLVEIHENQVRRALWCLEKEAVEQKNKYKKNQDPLQLIFPDTDDNKRLIGQSGLFSKGPVLKSVEAWIRQHFKKENRPILIKTSLPGNHTFRKLTLKNLELMNLTYSTIFPDLIGASKYCNIKAENYEA